MVATGIALAASASLVGCGHSSRTFGAADAAGDVGSAVTACATGFAASTFMCVDGGIGNVDSDAQGPYFCACPSGTRCGPGENVGQLDVSCVPMSMFAADSAVPTCMLMAFMPDTACGGPGGVGAVTGPGGVGGPGGGDTLYTLSDAGVASKYCTCASGQQCIVTGLNSVDHGCLTIPACDSAGVEQDPEEYPSVECGDGGVYWSAGRGADGGFVAGAQMFCACDAGQQCAVGTEVGPNASSVGCK